KRGTERRTIAQPGPSPERAGVRPGGTVGRRALAALARDEPQPAAVEGFAKRHRDLAGAVPAHFDDGRLLTGELECRGQAGGVAARMKDEIAVLRRGFGRRKAGTERPRKLGAGGRHVDDRDLRAR